MIRVAVLVLHGTSRYHHELLGFQIHIEDFVLFGLRPSVFSGCIPGPNYLSVKSKFVLLIYYLDLCTPTVTWALFGVQQVSLSELIF